LRRAGLAVSAGVIGTGDATAVASAVGDPPRGMTLATLRRNGKLSLGIRTEKGILDVVKAEGLWKTGAPTTVDAVIRTGGGNALAALVEKAKSGPASLFEAEDQADFGPCVTSPGKILCVGLNYRKHAAETGAKIPETPVLFNKFNSALNHHKGEIHVTREDATNFDYEVELVIVLGKTARNVKEADALSYVFGYCTGNDFTARELQQRTSQWMLGKTLDGSGPIGPWLVTADQVPDPNALKIECRVNGQVRQSSNTADMIFNCRQILAYASRYMTLEPGDIIFTGTPEGVILGYPKDKQVWLKAGDRVVSTIERLGELSFTLA
jgi:2-keto-4-pentenoate hydratase/2-oxohepta-3-ene-1,7-dioic acid hydratase in catechol pathway